MYTLNELYKGLKHPRLALEEVHRASSSLNKRLNYLYSGTKYNTNGADIFEEDWDNLIILDSCRFDYFQKHVQFNGKLDSRISRGSKTPEFIWGNFLQKSLLDVVYVSGNGWYLKLEKEMDSEIFRFEHVTDDVGKRKRGSLEYLCDKTTERAIEMLQEHPDKKLIIHYIPPHKPYVDLDGNIIMDFDYSSPYGLKHAGKSKSEVVAAYESSVKYILDKIQEVIDELSGRTIITSDHGELLGERMHPIPLRKYRHPRGIYVEPLVKVPWLQIEDGNRRKTNKANSPYRLNSVDIEQIDNQLRDLGYKID